MINAIPSSSTNTSPPDPTLDVLVPRRSTARNGFLATAAAALIVGVWASPLLLRPTVVPHDPAGAWAALAPHAEVVTIVRLRPQGWPEVDLRSVDDVPGASVAGSWVLPEGDYGLLDSLDPADFETGADYLEAGFGGNGASAVHPLPQQLESGAATQLVTLWRIEDCAALVAGEAPFVVTRSIVGTTHREQLDDIAAPGFDPLTLAETGLCPAP